MIEGRTVAITPLRAYGVAAALAGIAVVAQLGTYDRSLVPLDEGQAVAIGQRLVSGERMYSDIHTGIAPGVYYLTALLFGVFGVDAVVARHAQVVLNAGITACLWLLGLRAMRPRWAALAPLAYPALIAVGFPTLTMLNYSPLALALALAALLLFLRYLETGAWPVGAGVGILLAASVLTKQNFGALAALALAVSLVWARPGKGVGERSLLGSIAPILASGLITGLLVLAHFASRGSLGDFLYSTVVEMVQVQLGNFFNPPPAILAQQLPDDPRFVFQYLPPILFNYLAHQEPFLGLPISAGVRAGAIRSSYGVPLLLVLAAPLVLRLTRDLVPADQHRAAGILTLFAALFCLGCFPSAIWSHLAYVLPPVLLLGGLVGDRCEWLLARRSPSAGRILGWLPWAVALLGAVLVWRIGSDVRRWYSVPLDLPHASLVVDAEQAALYRGASAFIEDCAAPGEPIFAAPVLPLLYVITERPNPTPYDLVIPGAVRGEVIIERLEATRTRCVVYQPQMYAEYAPFDVLFPGVDALLRERFQPAVKIPGRRESWLGLTR